MASDSAPSRRRFLTGRFHGEQPVWRQVPTTGANPSDVLWGVWCDGPDHALVVGDGGAIHRLKGGAWRREESGVKEPLHAVVGFGGDNAVAVGWMGVIVHREDAGWHRNGGGIVDPITKRYAQTRANTPLFGLWASSPGDVWAVGDDGRVCRFDGTGWHEVDCPTDVHLRAVVRCRDGTLLVAGAQGTVLVCRNGEWARMETGTTTHLTGLHADGDGTVYAAGGQFNVRRNGFVGTVLSLRDGTWAALDSDEPLPRLRAVERVGDAVLAVGDHGTVARVEGDRLVTERVDTRRDLHGLAAAGGQRALSVGDGGAIIERTTVSADALPALDAGAAPVGRASPWEAVDGCPTDRVLWSVWGSEDQVVAVGDEGAIVAFDGRRWLSQVAPSPLHLHGVWGRRADQVYAVGDFATVIEFDGARLPASYAIGEPAAGWEIALATMFAFERARSPQGSDALLAELLDWARGAGCGPGAVDDELLQEHLIDAHAATEIERLFRARLWWAEQTGEDTRYLAAQHSMQAKRAAAKLAEAAREVFGPRALTESKLAALQRRTLTDHIFRERAALASALGLPEASADQPAGEQVARPAEEPLTAAASRGGNDGLIA